MLSVVPYLANGLSFWDIPSLTSFGLMSIFERYLGKVLSKFIISYALIGHPVIRMAVPKTKTQPSRLAVATCDVVGGGFVFWLIKDLLSLAHLNHIAQIHIGGVVRAAYRLLHIVRDDGDGVVML